MAKCHQHRIQDSKITYIGPNLSFVGLVNCNVPRAFIRISTVCEKFVLRLVSVGCYVGRKEKDVIKRGCTWKELLFLNVQKL